MRSAVALCIALLAAPAASAHITAVPPFAPAGSQVRIVLNVVNERLTHPMSGLTVRVPEGVSVESAERLGPWRSTVDGQDVRWSGGVLAPNFTADFALVLRMPRRAGAVELEAEQAYPDGGVTQWPVALTVTPGSASGGVGTGGVAVAAVAGLTLVCGTVLAVWLLRRRTLQER